MDKQPNEAQIKELYTAILDGKVKFGTVVNGEVVCYRQTTWNKEDEEWNIEVIPRTDSLEYLGWLLKYAVPKDTDVQISTGRGLAGEVNRWVVAIKYRDRWYTSEHEDLALAILGNNCKVKMIQDKETRK